MKITVKTLILILFAYIATPTILAVVDKSTDIVCFEDFAEENESIKEVKIEFNFITEISNKTVNFKKITSKITSKCKFKHEMISSKIFIPPPELV